MRKLFRDDIFFRGYPGYINIYIYRLVGINGAFARARAQSFSCGGGLRYCTVEIRQVRPLSTVVYYYPLAFHLRISGLIAVVAAARDPVLGFRSPEGKEEKMGEILPRQDTKILPDTIGNLCSLRSLGLETNAKFRIGRLVGNR